MKKLWAVLFAAIMLISLAACSKQVTDQSMNQADNQSTNQPEDKSAEQPSEDQSQEDETHKTITLEADNEYLIISAIDISDCKLENGYFTGDMTFIAQTTQKYIDEYFDYRGRQIYFGFYNENGDLVGDKIVQHNCVYDREYTWEDSTYVMVRSKYDISEVKVLKIVCEI